jgi:MFS family permease
MMPFEPLFAVAYGLYNFYMALYMKSQGLSDLQIGYLITIQFITSLILSFFAGPIVDRFGRKRTLLVAEFIAYSGSLLIWFFAQSFFMFMLGSIVFGFSSIVMIAWTCFVVEDCNSEQRVATFNLTSGIMLCSGFVAPIAGIIVNSMGIVNGQRLILLIAAALFAIRNLLRNHYGHETRTGAIIMEQHRQRESKIQLLDLYKRAFHVIIRSPLILGAMAFGLLFQTMMIVASFTTVCRYFVPYLTEALGFDIARVSVVGIFSSVSMLVVFVFVTPKLLKNDHRMVMLYAILSLIAATAILLMMPANTFWLLIVGIVLYSIGYQVLFPFVQSMLADATEGNERAGIYSLQSILVGTSTAVAGIVAGSLYTVNPKLLFGASLVILILMMILVAILRKLHQKSQEVTRDCPLIVTP